MKSLLILFIIALLSLNAHAQTSVADKKLLLCKTWHLYKYLGQDHKINAVSPDMQASYIKYNTNGTFEDKEEKTTYTGNWTFNTDGTTVTLTQTKSPDYPAKMELKILKLTDTELDAEANDFSSGVMTIYMHADK